MFFRCNRFRISRQFSARLFCKEIKYREFSIVPYALNKRTKSHNSSIKEDREGGQTKGKGKKGGKKQPNEVGKAPTYEHASDLYLLRELSKSLQHHEKENSHVLQIVEQFKGLLELYGLRIIRSPLPAVSQYSENTIHLRTEHSTENATAVMVFDILMDHVSSEETNSRELQLIASDPQNPDNLLYLMGDFTKDTGFAFNLAMMVDAASIGKPAQEIRDAICSGENWIFLALNNAYHKQLHVDDARVQQFLYTEELPEMDGKLFIDAFVNYTVLDSLHMEPGNQEGKKLISILWMLGSYCHNILEGKWYRDLKAFIELNKE